MLVRNILLFIVFISFTGICSAQSGVMGASSLKAENAQYYYYDEDDYASNAIFGEAFGNGFFLSFNYEKFINRHAGIRIGVGTGGPIGLTYPVMFNYYPGDSKKRLELGIGFTYFAQGSYFSDAKDLALGMTIGLRHQTAKRGPVIRLSFTPFYHPGKNRFLPFGGFSVGYAF